MRDELKFYRLTASQFVGHVIYARCDSFGFFSRCIRRKGEQSVTDARTDPRGGQPAAFVDFLFSRRDKLAGDRDVLVSIRRSVFFEQPSALFVKLNLQREPARGIDYACFLDVTFCQERRLIYGEMHWTLAIDFGALSMAHRISRVCPGFEMQPERRQDFFLASGAFAAGGQTQS